MRRAKKTGSDRAGFRSLRSDVNYFSVVPIPLRAPVPPPIPAPGPRSLLGADSPLPTAPLDGVAPVPVAPSVVLEWVVSLDCLESLELPAPLVLESPPPTIGALAPVPPLSAASPLPTAPLDGFAADPGPPGVDCAYTPVIPSAMPRATACNVSFLINFLVCGELGEGVQPHVAGGRLCVRALEYSSASDMPDATAT